MYKQNSKIKKMWLLLHNVFLFSKKNDRVIFFFYKNCVVFVFFKMVDVKYIIEIYIIFSLLLGTGIQKDIEYNRQILNIWTIDKNVFIIYNQR